MKDLILNIRIAAWRLNWTIRRQTAKFCLYITEKALWQLTVWVENEDAAIKQLIAESEIYKDEMEKKGKNI